TKLTSQKEAIPNQCLELSKQSDEEVRSVSCLASANKVSNFPLEKFIPPRPRFPSQSWENHRATPQTSITSPPPPLPEGSELREQGGPLLHPRCLPSLPKTPPQEALPSVSSPIPSSGIGFFRFADLKPRPGEIRSGARDGHPLHPDALFHLREPGGADPRPRPRQCRENHDPISAADGRGGFDDPKCVFCPVVILQFGVSVCIHLRVPDLGSSLFSPHLAMLQQSASMWKPFSTTISSSKSGISCSIPVVPSKVVSYPPIVIFVTRPYWRCYFPNTQAIIYVVDSSDTDRLVIAKEEFHAILEVCEYYLDCIMHVLFYHQRFLTPDTKRSVKNQEEELKGAVVLVYANKQDLPGALDDAAVTEALELHKIKNRQWAIFKTSAIKGEGLFEGLDWLSNTLKSGGG
ncbi:hypothetical protein Taro_011512, partial [Colocasia esculenta]|nr:hypothetical protein [Colocasia esculenta]